MVKKDYPDDLSKQIGKDSIYKYIYSERRNLVKTRPSIVEVKGRIGDYEGDMIVGKDKKSRLITNVDRLSSYGLIDRISKTSVIIIHNKLKNRFDKILSSKKHTYTYDNGIEIGKDD